MKKNYLILTSLLIGLVLLHGSNVLKAHCTCRNHCHKDQSTVRCSYTKSDIKKMSSRHPNRCKKGCCFYCGCAIEKHTEF